MRYLFILFSYFLFSCSTTQEVSSSTPKDVNYKTIKAFSDSGFENPTTQVITSQEELAAIWEQAMAHFAEVPECPQIDFSKNQVALIALGAKSNGGHQLKIESVTEDKNSVTVSYVEKKPGPNCVNTQAIVFPYELIEIPKSSKKVDFKGAEKVVDCK